MLSINTQSSLGFYSRNTEFDLISVDVEQEPGKRQAPSRSQHQLESAECCPLGHPIPPLRISINGNLTLYALEAESMS